MVLRSLRWLGQNLSTLLLAFALAVAVWLAVVVNSDPNQECTSPRTIPVEILGEDPGLRIMDTVPAQMSIQLYAPRSICEEIRTSDTPITAVLDLTGLGPGVHEVGIQPEIPSRYRPLRVLDYSPQEVTLTLEPLVSREVPIELDIAGEPALGFSNEPPVTDVSVVTVSGPESLVSRVEAAHASLSIADARQTVRATLALQPQDESGAQVSGVNLSPDSTEVLIPVRQLGGYRDVAVRVNTTGQWASGYRLTNISVSPPTVTVFSSNPQRVNELPGFVETEPVDLTDASDDLEARVALDLPAGITLVGDDQTVLVQVSIATIESNLTMSLPVEVIGIGPQYTAAISPEMVDIILFGPVPVLETLTPENVRVVVDLTDLEEGTHQVTPFVDILPDPVQEEGINPATVEVTLSSLPTPTPTATSVSEADEAVTEGGTPTPQP